jgi:hypothetical protein
MQSNLRAQAEIQAQRKKVRRCWGSCPGALVCAARFCSYPSACLPEDARLLAQVDAG